MYKDPQYQAKWHKKNDHKYTPARKRWQRKHILQTGGRKIRVLKRDYPEDECCELCGKEGRRLCYHHWDDTNLSLGMWICCRCHQIAHGIEDGYISKYIELKEEIEG